MVTCPSHSLLSSCRKTGIGSIFPGWQWPFPWPPCVRYWPSWWCFSSSWQHGRSGSQRVRTAQAHRRWLEPDWRWAVSSKCPQRRDWSEAPSPVCRPASSGCIYIKGGVNTLSVVWMFSQWVIVHLGKLLMLKPQRWTAHRLRGRSVGERMVEGCSEPEQLSEA